MEKSGKIIAMWSGPRNLSTAMMRSFGARNDCDASDEPFYAAYLAATGLKHPMREEIIADGETDPAKVIERCIVPPPPSKITYQKHMTHHMIDGFDVSWISKVTNVFLIRDPARVLASYANKTEHVTAHDIGFLKQLKLIRLVEEKTAQKPIIIDAHDIRADPKAALTALCQAVEIPFDDSMLHWTAGAKPEDGIWASHWYDAVWRSTGFAPPDDTPLPKLTGKLAKIEAQVRPVYEEMRHGISA